MILSNELDKLVADLERVRDRMDEMEQDIGMGPGRRGFLAAREHVDRAAEILTQDAIGEREDGS